MTATPERARLIRLATRGGEYARKLGCGHLAEICDAAVAALIALEAAERRIAELQLGEGFDEQTRKRDLNTQEIKRLHAGGVR